MTTVAPASAGGGYVWQQAPFAGAEGTDTIEIRGVTHTGSEFVAVGHVIDECAQVWVSEDGMSWAATPGAGGSVSPPCRMALVDVGSNGDISVAVGTHGTMDVDGYEAEATAMVSDNGYDWSHPDGGDWTPFGMGEVVTSVAGSELGFVAAGSGLWFSANPLDGQPWSEAIAPAVSEIVDVAAGPNGFFAVGDLPGSVSIFDQQWSRANAVLHSPDGQTWSVVAALEGAFQAGSECWIAANAITHGPHGYVIVGDCQSEEAAVAYGSVWTSFDGFVWNQVPYDQAAFGDPAYITTIAADDNGYLAGGWSLDETESHATVWFSRDGSEWVRTELSDQGSSATLAVVAYEGTAVAVGHTQFQPIVWRGVGQETP